MRYELFLALRYLGGLRRSQPFVSVIAAISVLGVALGVAALLVVLGVMSGFDADLQQKIIGSNPHLIVQVDGGITDPDSLVQSIRLKAEVVEAAPFVQTQVLLRHGDNSTGVILRGTSRAWEPPVIRPGRPVSEGGFPLGPEELVVGSELMERWGLRPGDSITVIGGEKGAKRSLTVVGEFTTGMYEYDMHLALAAQETVQQVMGWEGRFSGIGIRLKEPLKAPSVQQGLQRQLGFPYWVASWIDMNRNLFAALKLEKVTMFLILTLIVLVACFNIVATLLMVVVSKTKEVGILKAVGATQGSIHRIFTFAGLLIGGLGTLLGTGLGLSLCGALAKYQFIQLPPEIYYIDRLPVKLEWPDALAVIGAALVISWGACLYPAAVAARMPPAEALRYE
jgi:lipoprotein-releasing system permease protein